MKTIYQKKLCGGLGNQLFMVFYTISLSLKNNCDYYFIPNKKYIANDTRDIRGKTTLLFDNIANKLDDKIKRPVIDDSHQIVKVKGTYNQVLDYNRFEEIINIIGFRNYQITIKNKYRNIFNPKYKYVSIHFRYTDYKNKNCHQIIKKNYYINCLNLLLKKEDINKLKFLIFFERYDSDILEIISILKNMFNIDYEIINPKIDADETLVIQSICNYNIIANSTFSLWSALLNNNIDRKVFSPKNCKNTHNAIYRHYNFIRVNIY